MGDMNSSTYPHNLRCCRTAARSYHSGYGAGAEYATIELVSVPDHGDDPHGHHYALGFIDGNADRAARPC